MFALFLIISLLTTMAGLVAIVIGQIARARRQQYLEETALNRLGCAEVAEFQRKVSARKPVANPVPASSRNQTVNGRKQAHRTLARHPHSPLLAR